MNWAQIMSEAVSYIEDNITNDICIENVSKHICVSGFYFQKCFSILCGYTIGEYVRSRRLTLAAEELLKSDIRVLDLAIKYGYDSPDSFTKAFARFHNATPNAVRSGGKTIKMFAPLKIKISLEGGYIMDYKIEKKNSFLIKGISRKFAYDGRRELIPNFWSEYYAGATANKLCGKYGVCIDENYNSKEFDYWIADDCAENEQLPEGCKSVRIPALTWAVFPIKGALPNSLQSTNIKIFSEWLPNCNDYEISAGYNIELYSNPADFKNGTQDENYYCEIWVPVKEKA